MYISLQANHPLLFPDLKKRLEFSRKSF